MEKPLAYGRGSDQSRDRKGVVDSKGRKYLAYFCAWTVVGLFNFSRDLTRRLYLHESTRWQGLLATWMVGMYICAALTPAILWLGRRWPIERRGWLRRVALHVLFSILFAVVELALEAVVYARFGLLGEQIRNSFWLAFPALMVVGFHGNVMTYWVVLGIQHGWRYYRSYQDRELHAAELQAQVVQAQLSALKVQLQPHFLFNTLNAIIVLVRQRKSHEAEETLARFSDLLRCVLEDVEAQEVPLRRELEYLRLYLSIEQVRFSDRLRVEIVADPHVLEAAVPHMSLQPIVENAVRHGIGQRALAGAIELRAFRVNGSLQVRVQDDGPGFPAGGDTAGQGIGLSNTRARLQRLYGEGARLTTENSDSGGAVVTMVLPFRELYAANDLDRR
jgi:two-component system LytT family sensor kinase